MENRMRLPVIVSAVFFAIVVLMSGFAQAGMYNPLTNATINRNVTTIAQNSTYNITFDVNTSEAYNLTFVNITFPVGTVLNKSVLFNSSIIVNNTINLAANGSIVSFYNDSATLGPKLLLIFNMTFNVSYNASYANATMVLNLSGITNNRTAYASQNLTIETFTAQNSTPTESANATPTYINTPGVIAFVNISVNQTFMASVVSGVRVNVSANGYDLYLNLNNSGGFNFSANSTTIAIYATGNGTNYSEFLMWKNGTVNITALSSRATSIRNDTGVDVVVNASDIVNITAEVNISSATSNVQLRINATGYDHAGNVNNSGGFNFSSNNTNILINQSVQNVTATPAAGSYMNTSYLTWIAGQAKLTVTAIRNASATASYTNQTVTVSAGNIVNLTVTNTTSRHNATSPVGTFNFTATGYDVAGNVNNSGGFNWSSNNVTAANLTVAVAGIGNETRYGLFNATAINVSAAGILINVTAFHNLTGAVNSSQNVSVLSPNNTAYYGISGYSFVAGTDFHSMSVYAFDQFNNRVTNDTSVIGLTQSGADVPELFYFNTIPSTASVTMASGVGTFTVRYVYADSITVNVSNATFNSNTSAVTFTAAGSGGSGSSGGSGGSSFPTPTPSSGATATPTGGSGSTPTPTTGVATPTPGVISGTPTPEVTSAPGGSGSSGGLGSMEMAQSEIGNANALKAQADGKGIDTSEASSLIAAAQQAQAAGNYAQAEALAKQAQEKLQQQISAANAQPAGGDNSWIMWLVIILVVIGGGYYYYTSQKKK